MKNNLKETKKKKKMAEYKIMQVELIKNNLEIQNMTDHFIGFEPKFMWCSY